MANGRLRKQIDFPNPVGRQTNISLPLKNALTALAYSDREFAHCVQQTAGGRNITQKTLRLTSFGAASYWVAHAAIYLTL